MKKIIAILLALTLILSFAGCAGTNDTTTTAGTTEGTTAGTTAGDEVEVMTYAEYIAAELESAVVVEAYVQAVESWYDGACHIYALCEDGGYYIYSYACTEEEAAKLVPGTKIRVSGYKIEWSGEVEISEATIEILDGQAPEFAADDVTELVGTDALAERMNDLVAFKGMTVAASKDANGNEAPFLYKWDGSGKQGDDLYFNVSIGETVYTFTVNVYMIGTGVDSDVYKAVEALKVGDVIDIEGFLYWYNAPQTHVTAVTAAE